MERRRDNVDAQGRLPQTCRFFNTPQGCRFGASCKFPHTVDQRNGQTTHSINNTNGVPASRRVGFQGSAGTQRQSLIQWRYSIPLRSTSAQPLGIRLPSFLQTALDLVDTDPGIVQEVILALTSEGGFLRIKEILDRDFESMSDLAKTRVMLDQMTPFFKIVTHCNVASSIMLEDKVASIFNFLYGHHGERAVKVFTFVIKAITLSGRDLCSVTALEPLLAAFSSMIDINSHALVNEQLPPLADFLCDACNNSIGDVTPQLRRLISKIARRLDVRHTLENIQDQPRPPQTRASFILPHDLPGQLSIHGPRHDNDHADIQNVRILPTFDEIKAARPPYLPPRDAMQQHLDGIEGLLDRHFRLLREDTVGQLRDAISTELEQGQALKNAARVNTYSNLVVMDIKFSRYKGLQLLVRIDQPQHLRQASVQVRKDWWEYTNRLRPDALVCIIGKQDQITFCTVSELSHATKGQAEKQNQDPDAKINIYSHPSYSHLQLSLVNPDPSTITRLLKQLHTLDDSQRLVEFPGVLLPSFQPTLEALKKMSQKLELPFVELLAPVYNGKPMADGLTPPLYAMTPEFHYDLSSVMKDKSTTRYTVNSAFDIQKFKANTVLDDAQAEALLHCLGQSLALIQGPPGTGKSFTGIALIKILLAVKKKAKLGPILCVCFTNHALDQLLEHLFHHGVKQIIRMGSRSKSEILENCNLRVIAKNMSGTAPEKKERWEMTNELQTEEQEIESILKKLAKPGDTQTVKAYLEMHYPHHHDELFGDCDNIVDEDGFQTVYYGSGNPLQDWLNGKHHGRYISTRNTMTSGQMRLFDMPHHTRQILYRHWLVDIEETSREQLVVAVESHRVLKARFDRIRDGQDLRCLQEADVIGVTTSGLARQLDLLRKLTSKVMVCEEAGEVLEAHILTALLPSLEHVILIGDHLQLPPHIQNYDLSRHNPRGEQYSLDLSLFERLVVTDDPQQALPFSTLEIQRRMHPSISELIRSTLYPKLKDYPDVHTYPGVAGMKKRLFWLDHRRPETGADPTRLATTSHSNDFEVGMVVALVTHLVRQGIYAANEIAVLTPYLGQLYKIRRVLRNQFEITMNERDELEMQRQGLVDEDDAQPPVKAAAAKTSLLKALAVSTIDNFQGEEAKVVVISLVRSNPQNKCGFLRTSNRINVLLSRAQHGMYIIGNAETSGHVGMWADVISILQRDGNFGTQLELECPRHPDTPILVSEPDHFIVFSPEGGCDKKCDKRLDCGHRDHSKCHSEALHNAVKCLEPCSRQLKGCDHSCPRLCGEACIINCQVQMHDINVKLECGHVKSTLPCWQVRQPSAVRCRTIVQKTVSGCEHVVDVDCFVDPTSDSFRCETVCGSTLPCGHTCQKSCHQCTSRQHGSIVSQDHGACQRTCGKKFNNCQHHCQLLCHGETPCECNASCENFCEHSRCGKRCGEPCTPCAEINCANGACPHTQSCSMPCSAPCDWLPCGNRCDKLLVCGHQCPTICGENCPPPQFCQVCASQDVKDTVVDYIMMTTYAEVDLDEDPCVIPACGHILTVSSMDGQMEMAKHYMMDDNAATRIRDDSKPFSMDELKVCGTCRGSLRNIVRYGRIVRRALLDEATKKFIQWAGVETIALTETLHQCQRQISETLHEEKTKKKVEVDLIKLEGTPLQQLGIVRKHAGKRYNKLINLRNRISEHIDKVQIEEQPFKRVWDLVQHAKRNKDNVGHMHFDTDVLQTRETVRTTSLLIKTDLAILSDFIALKRETDLKLNLAVNKASCDELIQAALEANQPLHAVEGHIFFAQYCAAERSHGSVDRIDDLIHSARGHVANARAICDEYPGSTRHVVAELDDVEEMLRSSTFFMPMRDDEWKTVMAAMSDEFRGSGHWYTCANNHPFTIGECGMPMEQARCPQCDAPIGGQNHTPAAGVSAATDLERRFGRMRF